MAENNSSAPLLPCPFCGGPAGFKDGGCWHGAGCIDLPCPGYPIALAETSPAKAAASWNTRAPQAVAAQAAPAAVAVPECERCGLSPAEHGLMHWCDNQSFKHEDGTVQMGATPALPATEDSSAGDLATESASRLTLEQAEAMAFCSTNEPTALLRYWFRKGYTAAAAQAEPATPYAWHYWNAGGASVYHRGESKKLEADMSAAAAYPRVHHCIPLYTAPQAQPADSLDAARYRWLRDNDWRENQELEPVIRLQLNAIWDKKIDAAMAAAQEGGNAAKEA